MTNSNNKKNLLSRRSLLSAPPLLATALAASGASAQQTVWPYSLHQSSQPVGKSDELIVVFSRTGNTRLAAHKIHDRRQSDWFEILVRRPYPNDYEQTVERASREREDRAYPDLTEGVSAIERYRTVFVCFPIWGMDVAAPMCSFLQSHDLSGKRLLPVITHGGYGTGNALNTLARLAPYAEIALPFTMQSEMERSVIERVDEWLGVG